MTTPIEIIDFSINYYTTFYNHSQEEFIRSAMKNIIEALEEVKERIEKECWWIPVGEKLPEENSEIIFYENWKVIIWRYEISISWDTPLFFWNNWMYTNTVTHWMPPLPTPPNQ